MPDIEFRLTAIDEATPVIDRARQKMDQFNRNTAGVQPRPAPTFNGRPAPGMPKKDPSGMGGMLGGGKVGTMAGLTIIAQAALQVLQKINQRLMEASPYLATVAQQFKTAMNMYLRPLGDSLAKALAPKSEYALEVAEKRANSIAKLDEEFGVVGAALGTFGFLLYDVKMALWEFNYGVWDMLSKVWLWPIDKLGDILGVDLPGSLTELLDSVFGIKGGFQGIQEWMENLPEALAGLGTDIWNGITGAFSDAWDEITGFGTWLWEQITKFVGDPLGTLSGFGTWLWESLSEVFSNAWNTLSGFGTWIWGKITGALTDAWTTISGFGTWLWDEVTGVFDTAWTFLTDLGTNIYNGIWNKVKGIGGEAYNAFHNAVASLLNSIANIELPLVGKPFKGLFGTIPMLASGGIVTQPTLAMIGERGAEAVIPLNRGGLGMNQGQQVTIQINAPIYGVSDLESAIDSALRRSRMGFATYG